MADSKIEWTDKTWNPVAGCTIVSPGCTNCYAMQMAARLERFGQDKYAGLTRKSGGRAKWTGEVRFWEKNLDDPRKWKKPCLIFVNSMSDVLHEDLSLEIILRIFKVMVETPRHTYQVLTKRAERLAELSDHLPWPDNIWMGVSVENVDYLHRIDHLRDTGAAVKFLSLEPLLGPLDDLNLDGIDWVIAGGESGNGARPMDPDWARAIRDQCVSSGVPFHFKQWGGKNKKPAGRELDGRTWDEWPSAFDGRQSAASKIAAE